MERFKGLREELEKIIKEAADWQIAQKSADQARIDEEARRRIEAEEKESSRKRLIEERWKETKGVVMSRLKELNEVVPGSSGKIIDWQMVTSREIHYHRVGGYDGPVTEGSPDQSSGYCLYFPCQTTVEVARLKIPGIGSVDAFRVFDHKKGSKKNDINSAKRTPINEDFTEKSKDKLILGFSLLGKKTHFDPTSCEIPLTEESTNLEENIDMFLADALKKLYFSHSNYR